MPIRQNSPQAWWLAARPKTLSAAFVPVVVALALLWRRGHFALTPALACIAFAALMQIAANFINDLYDFRRGADREDRLGPERACAQGWITPRAMMCGIALTIAAACAAGLTAVACGGRPLVALGASCVVFAFLYTTLLSYIGLGDVLVWVFFGFVPVAGTCLAVSGTIPPEAWWAGAGCGLAVGPLLVVNNFRDREQDRLSGKRTLIVAFGARFGLVFYVLQGLSAAICAGIALGCSPGLPLFGIYCAMHLWAARSMWRIRRGRALNRVLGATSLNIMLYGLLFSAAWLLE